MAVDGLTATERRDAVIHAHQEALVALQATIENVVEHVKAIERRVLQIEAMFDAFELSAKKDAEPLIMVPTYSGKIQ